MAELLRTLDDKIADSVGKEYEVRVCAAEQASRLWEGWLEFVPGDGSMILRSGRETTQPNLEDSKYWAQGLTTVFAEGSLARTLDPIAPIRRVPKARPAYDGPAPSRYSLIGNTPVLDPFAVYLEGGSDMLRRRLTALGDRHLRHIALHYFLIDPRTTDPDTAPADVLIEKIVEGVVVHHSPPAGEASTRPAA